MTTVVYVGGIMAGDGRETYGAPDESELIVRDDCVKVWKLADGSLLGAAKASEDIERVRRALEKGKKPPKGLEVNAIHVSPKGRIRLYEGSIWQDIRTPYYAVGSGSIFAFPLLKYGITDAVRIVEVVSRECDPFSGGQIHSVALKG